MQVQQLTCVGSYVYPLLLMLTLLQLFCTGLVVAPDASTDNVNDNVNDDDDSNDIGGDNSVPHLGALQGTFIYSHINNSLLPMIVRHFLHPGLAISHLKTAVSFFTMFFKSGPDMAKPQMVRSNGVLG